MAEERHEHHELEEEVGQAVGPVAPGPEAQDAASASLSEALRVSFRLLTFIMIGVVVAFLLSGISFVDPYEVGLRRVFGRIVGQVDEGLAYTSPFPVGEIDTVGTQNRQLVVDDFWLHETPADKAKPLGERRPGGEGLRPGWDGYLVTGDRSLLHAKLTVTYAVSNAAQFRTGAADPEALLRDEICTAAIHAAARRTAAGLKSDEYRSAFVSDVKTKAQARLDRYEVGMRIVDIKVGDNITWPLATLPAFRAVQEATNRREGLRKAAESDATTTLRSAAGESFRKLVGDLDYVVSGGRLPVRPQQSPGTGSSVGHDGPTLPGDPDSEFDLIGEYQAARNAETRNGRRRCCRRSTRS